jgi:hypothetical protein
VQNEPNSRRGRVGRGLGDEGRLCKTKPIWRGVGRGRPTYQEPIVRNKAKLGRTGTGGQRRSSCTGRLRREVERAKRTQFAATPRGTGTKRAKRTQFRRAGRPDTPPFHCSIIPVLQSDPDHAKRSQTWAGWDIWGTARQGGANGTKRTQSAAGVLPVEIPPVFHHPNIPVVQNEANFPRPSPGTDGRGIPFALDSAGRHNLIGP